MKRRTTLRAIGTVGLTAIAGCLQDGTGSNGDGGGDGSPEDTGTPGVTSRSIQVTGKSSGSKAQSAAVEFTKPLTITGTTTGRNGCYTAVLGSVEYEDGKLVVTVRAEEDEGGTDACTQAITNVDYEARIGVSDGQPDTVVVKHESMGETKTVTTASP
jgi:hypothetical protein